MSKRNPIWRALAAVVLSTLATPAAAQDAELVKRFLSEAPPAWEKFDKATEYAQGSIGWTIRRMGLENVIETEVTLLIGVTCNERCTAIKVSPVQTFVEQDQSGAANAFVQNPVYVIEITRKSSDEAWQLDHAGKEWSDAHHFTPTTMRSWLENKTQISRGASATVGQFPSNHVRPVHELVTDPGFAVTDVRVDNDGLWRVSYRIDPKKTQKFSSDVSQGVFLFDPSHNWRLVRSEKSGEDNRTTLAFEYSKVKEEGDTLPRGLEWTEYFADETGKYVKQINFRFKIKLSVPDKLPPDSDFTATAYGLKEPDLKDIK